MTVYIDNMQASYRGMKMCHMVADTLEELHDMATKLGLRRYFQEPPKASKPHYDVSLTKKREALTRGAIEGTRHDMVICSNKLLIEWIESSDATEEVKRSLIAPSAQMIRRAEAIRDGTIINFANAVRPLKDRRAKSC